MLKIKNIKSKGKKVISSIIPKIIYSFWARRRAVLAVGPLQAP
jgi:hypothetical protein